MTLCLQRWVRFYTMRNMSNASLSAKRSAATTDDQDLFGTLSESGSKRLELKNSEENAPDDRDGYDKLEWDIIPRKNAYYYKYEITKYARQGGPGLRRALELFHEMKAVARLTPTMHNFSPLIYGCARAGFTKRAFDLYEESLQYTKPSNSIITCLINACAESPFPEYGIERLNWFLSSVKARHGKSLNEIHYNSAIKAYGKLGHLEQASKLIQEMIDNDVMPTIDTFNMLLIGCASDKEAGCTFALRVYKRIKMYDMKPTLITYRLLLRCIRDCDMGSSRLLLSTLEELPALSSLDKRLEYERKKSKVDSKKNRSINQFVWTPLFSEVGKSFSEAVREPITRSVELCHESKHYSGEENMLKLNEELHHDSLSDSISMRLHKSEQALPNLLSDDHLDLLMRVKGIDIDKLKQKTNRIILFGGMYGFMSTMIKDGIKPDNKTFSLILECLEPTRENHLQYHKLACDMNVNRDLAYYDLLLRHICRNISDRHRLELALYFVEKMHLDNLRPNISTFEALTRGCHHWTQAEKMIRDVEKCGFIVSDDMITNFFVVAIYRRSDDYLSNLLDYCRVKGFKPTRMLVERLEAMCLKTNEIVRRHELNDSRRTSTSDKKCLSSRQVEDFDIFREKFEKWLREVELKEDEHPWAQFDVERGSQKRGFFNYVRQMEAAEQAKQEALKTGNRLGNLYYKATKSAKVAPI